MSDSLPILRFHAPTKQHYVWSSELKKRITFGRDKELAKQRYALYLAGLTGNASSYVPPDRATVSQVLEAYRQYANQKYTDPTERDRIETAITAVLELYGNQPAASFKAKAFRDVRARMLTTSRRKGNVRCRNYVNKLAGTIKTIWRWLASEELVPAESAQSVCMVPKISHGDGGVEKLPVLPPCPTDVEKTIAAAPKMVADMLRVQLLTGARPKEIRTMRLEEISRSPDQPIPLPGTGQTVAALRCGETVVWVMAQAEHKTLKRGKSHVVVIGPKAQKILDTWFREEGGFVFLTRLGTVYRKDSYARAVARACVKAGVKPWAPNQLRHKKATDIAGQFDHATAAAVLGHAAGSGATRVYVEQAIRRGAEAMAEVG
jgi:integrase